MQEKKFYNIGPSSFHQKIFVRLGAAMFDLTDIRPNALIPISMELYMAQFYWLIYVFFGKKYNSHVFHSTNQGPIL